MQEASSLQQVANLVEHRRRPGSRDAQTLAHVEDSQTAQGEKAEERAQETACSMVHLASAQVGRKRARRTPLIDPGKRVRKACYGNRGWWHMTPGRALTGNGWRWTARGPKPRLGGGKVGKHPTDRGQSGTKRSVRTDGGGVPIGLAVAGTHRHDGTMARETIEPSAVERPSPTAEMPKGRCLDTG